MSSRSKPRWWVTPAWSLGIGAVLGGLHLASGEPDDAAKTFALMAGLAAVLSVGGGSALIRSIRGDDHDERTAALDLRAAAITLAVLVSAVVAMAIYEWTQDRTGTPYVQLTTLGALAFVISSAVLRRWS